MSALSCRRSFYYFRFPLQCLLIFLKSTVPIIITIIPPKVIPQIEPPTPSITKHCSISIRNSYECSLIKFRAYNCINQISAQPNQTGQHYTAYTYDTKVSQEKLHNRHYLPVLIISEDL